jgi:TolB-like protein
MIFSTNFSNNSVVLIAAILICLTGCSRVNGPVTRVTNDSSAIEDKFPIAVLPIYNLSGSRAPLKDIRESLINSLKKTGVDILDEKVLERVIVRHRIRYVGGIDISAAKAFKEEAGAGSVLITSLELYNTVFPPKISLISRLVSTDVTTSILWMKGIGLAGDDSPGILGIGLIENPMVLSETATNDLATSLSEYLSGRREGVDTTKKRNKFWPKVIYRSPVLSPSVKYRVVIPPFLNVSERKYADEIIALHFVNQLLAYENFNVVEPGVVRKALLGLRVIMDDGLSLANADITFSRLNSDLILTGKVIDYQDYQGPGGKPKVDFSAQMIDRKSREVVWSSKSYNEGDDGVFFFDLGRVNTAHVMASEMVNHVVEMIVE